MGVQVPTASGIESEASMETKASDGIKVISKSAFFIFRLCGTSGLHLISVFPGTTSSRVVSLLLQMTGKIRLGAAEGVLGGFVVRGHRLLFLPRIVIVMLGSRIGVNE